MKVTQCSLAGVLLIEPQVFSDHRGFFLESYHAEKYKANGIAPDFKQDNHSLSREPYVLRGLHYQLEPHVQSKLVRVTAGSVLDVVVDIRRGSPTFGRWASFVLSADNKHQLFVPKGFAHGFCTLEPDTEVQYKVDALYAPQHDRGIAWNDPELAIEWPTNQPILSEKDRQHPSLAEAELSFEWEGEEG